MSRDHRRFGVFSEADALVVELYGLTAAFPAYERFGLQAQLRRAGVSVPANVVEGSARDRTADYCRFLEIAQGSAREECQCLLGLAARLGFVDAGQAATLASRYDAVATKLLATTQTLKARTSRARVDRQLGALREA